MKFLLLFGNVWVRQEKLKIKWKYQINNSIANANHPDIAVQCL
jgi:hypothetical protein